MPTFIPNSTSSPHQPITAESLISIDDIATLLGADERMMAGLLSGPFRPVQPGYLTLRSVLGLYVTLYLNQAELMSLGHIVNIAESAAEGAKDGGNRGLLIAWEGRKPMVQWVSPGSPNLDAALHVPVMLLPVDQMLEDLGQAVAELRAQRHSRLN